MNNETRIERLNATLYLAVNVPASRLDQGYISSCIGAWCTRSGWHTSRLGFDRWAGDTLCSWFGDFHGISRPEAEDIIYENAELKGEAARRDVVEKLKALIIKYGGETGAAWTG